METDLPSDCEPSIGNIGETIVNIRVIESEGAELLHDRGRYVHRLPDGRMIKAENRTIKIHMLEDGIKLS